MGVAIGAPERSALTASNVPAIASRPREPCRTARASFANGPKTSFGNELSLGGPNMHVERKVLDPFCSSRARPSHLAALPRMRAKNEVAGMTASRAEKQIQALLGRWHHVRS